MQQQNLEAVPRCDMPDLCNIWRSNLNACGCVGGGYSVGHCVSSGKGRLPLSPGSLISVMEGLPGRGQALPPWWCSAGVAGTVCVPDGTWRVGAGSQRCREWAARGGTQQPHRRAASHQPRVAWGSALGERVSKCCLKERLKMRLFPFSNIVNLKSKKVSHRQDVSTIFCSVLSCFHSAFTCLPTANLQVWPSHQAEWRPGVP